MPSYTPPINDVRFILNEVINLEKYSNVEGFENASPETVDAILEEAGKFCAEVLYPLNAVGDREGCTWHPDGSVTTPTGFKEAYQQMCEAGWTTLSAPEEFGGQGLPRIVGNAVMEFMISANQALEMYTGLTQGAIASLLVEGNAEQKAKYVPNMVAGKWGGTMNLTEPQCGTDLGMIRTKAEPQADGSYRITGQKIWISGGEHDMTENIIHLVLAKTPDAPDSTKGISLFVVPKFLVNDDGSLGERNAVKCGGLEEKMGIHGNSTCVMHYDGATGWLVGEENKGLRAMFIMMNAARLGVGLQGLAQAQVAYENAVGFANERRQGRSLTGAQSADEKADLIFVHPDVRRMLMESKAFIEAMRAVVLWGALQVDLATKAATEEEREMADTIIGLVTPVIKGYGTHKGYAITNECLQVLGGSGYTRDWGQEQIVRDTRISMIYEGTNGVQAMDLVGRKLGAKGGQAIQAFFRMIADECAGAKSDERLKRFAEQLEAANGELQASTLWFMANGMQNPNHAGAGAFHYMEMMGIVFLGLMWLRMAKAAASALDAGRGNASFYEAKLVTARYFAERYFPDCAALRHKIEGGADSIMALTPEQFAVA